MRRLCVAKKGFETCNKTAMWVISSRFLPLALTVPLLERPLVCILKQRCQVCSAWNLQQSYLQGLWERASFFFSPMPSLQFTVRWQRITFPMCCIVLLWGQPRASSRVPACSQSVAITLLSPKLWLLQRMVTAAWLVQTQSLSVPPWASLLGCLPSTETEPHTSAFLPCIGLHRLGSSLLLARQEGQGKSLQWKKATKQTPVGVWLVGELRRFAELARLKLVKSIRKAPECLDGHKSTSHCCWCLHSVWT